MESLHLQQLGGTLYEPTVDIPYARIVVDRNSPLTLLDLFMHMLFWSGEHAGGSILCWNFMPRLHLYLHSRRRQCDGLSGPLQDWNRVERILNYWIDDGSQRSTGMSVYLDNGLAFISRQAEPSLFNDLALKIIRE